MLSQNPNHAISTSIVAAMAPMHVLPLTSLLIAALSVSSFCGFSCVVVADGCSGPVKPNDGFFDDAPVSGRAVILLVETFVVPAAELDTVEAPVEAPLDVAGVSPWVVLLAADVAVVDTTGSENSTSGAKPASS